MKKEAAILLLAACKPLADKLTVVGIDVDLTVTDCAALVGFNMVQLYDEGCWLEENQVFGVAGLQRSNIAALSFLTARFLCEKIYLEHSIWRVSH